jgi:hypothetical protein
VGYLTPLSAFETIGTEKCSEGRHIVLIEVLSRNSPGENEEINEITKDGWFSDQDLKQESPEYKFSSSITALFVVP